MKRLIALSLVLLFGVSGCVTFEFKEMQLEPELKKQASVDGKYEVLIGVVEYPEDKADYGEFHDYGYWPGGPYKEFPNLPKGYWVYVYPKWYIWNSTAGAAQAE